MTDTPQLTAVGRKQALLALLALCSLFSVLGPLAWCVRNPALAAWLDQKTEQSCRETRKLLYHRGWFQAPEELWIYQRSVPPDYARGGVYFFGSSYVQFSTLFWKLSPELQSLIHNYGMPASNPKSDGALIDYLSRDRGMLAAPGPKNLVVFGAAYQTTFYPSESLPPSWVNAWERHDLFTCDLEHGVQPVTVNPIEHFINFEETFEAACLTRFQTLAAARISRWRNHGTEPARVHQPALYIEQRREEMSTNWLERIHDGVHVMRRNFENLQARGVQVRVVFMPEGSWENGLPYSPEFRREVTSLCAEKKIPISDWSHLLTDDEFADSAHPNIYGMEKEQAEFLKIARPFLHSTGELP